MYYVIVYDRRIWMAVLLVHYKRYVLMGEAYQHNQTHKKTLL